MTEQEKESYDDAVRLNYALVSLSMLASIGLRVGGAIGLVASSIALASFWSVAVAAFRAERYLDRAIDRDAGHYPRQTKIVESLLAAGLLSAWHTYLAFNGGAPWIRWAALGGVALCMLRAGRFLIEGVRHAGRWGELWGDPRRHFASWWRALRAKA